MSSSWCLAVVTQPRRAWLWVCEARMADSINPVHGKEAIMVRAEREDRVPMDGS